MVDVDEKTKADEEPVVTMMKSIARYVADRVKEKKKEKDVNPKSSMKDIVTKKEKTPKGKSVIKRRKVESKPVEKKSLKGNLVWSSDSEKNVEEDVLDIMSNISRNVGGKIILVNVLDASMDNVSFHSETCVLKWKYVFQKSIAWERNLDKKALDCI